MKIIPVLPDSFTPPQAYPVGEYLCQMIERSVIGGVLPEMNVKVSYDEDGVDIVDPSTDISTDPFLMAELLQDEFSRRQARIMTETANTPSTPSASEGALDPVNSAESGAPSAPASPPSE